MKIGTKNIVKFLIVASLINLSCSKDGSNPADGNTGFSTKGTDYLPDLSGKTVKFLISGSVTEYDSLGNITSRIATSSEEFTGAILPTTVVNNIIGNPVYYQDRYSTKLFGYLSSSNGAIIGIDSTTKFQGALLPSELSIGMEWIPNAQRPIKEQAKLKLIESLSSYTNSAGNNYQNVIKINASYIYNYTQSDIHFSYSESLIMDGLFYLAKGKGLIEVSINNYEEIYESNYSFGSSYYKKTKIVGNAGLNN